MATKSASGAPKKVGSTVKTMSGLRKASASMTGRLPSMKEKRCDHTFEAGGTLRDIKRGATDDGRPGRALSAIDGPPVVIADAPGGIVGWRGDDANLVAPGREPCGHLTRVLADAGKLGSVVQAVDQDSHARLCGRWMWRMTRMINGWGCRRREAIRWRHG